ncbi:MAG: hypothetical protein LVQ95_03685 [Candidatus Micrarchaeales archaeon]|nr:hypothetical protein [Candidatus Micrarchaeales archaeon]
MKRSQSAIEYLMTYGWSILVIVVVLAILFAFNIFNPKSLSTNNCRSFENFVCTNLVLNTSGYLSVNIGAYGPTITATGIACTNSSAPAPVSFYPLPNLTIQSAFNYSFVVPCPAPGAKIGSRFNGVIWLRYNSGNTLGLIATIAAFSATASTQSSVSPSRTTSTTSSTTTVSSSSTSTTTIPAISYVPITLTNSQSSPTPAPFQQYLVVSSYAYVNYINSNWDNVEFSTGPGATGTILKAWVEWGASTASTTGVWINLPSGIGASSSYTIYMNFMPSNVMNATCAAGANPETSPSTCDTGEAPSLSSTYAQYDTGAQVFNFYDNFAGTSLGSEWTVSGGWGYSVNDGLTVISSPGSGGSIHSGATFNYPFDVDFYGNPTNSSGCSPVGEMGVGTSAWTSGGNAAEVTFTNCDIPSLTQAAYGSSATNGNTYTSGASVYTVEVVSASEANFYKGTSGPLIGSIYSNIPPSPQPVAAIIAACCGGTYSPTPTLSWIRTRAYPPLGQMPTPSFGSVV